ncbi:leucine-rich repeat-containing protein 56 [Megalops cyprinoides]|uniref:leucine-rich repeat-containing protein 56 n=1 Tax=Megalops cyprinoides TaxID=118141 RepID=UPI0018655B66|nr:leucine-rich repeat-containing protein 56 [Megalops cyprinoides]
MHSSRDRATVVRPGTPRVSVTELSGCDQINPTPSINEDSELLAELCLSPEKLKDLTGTPDLRNVTTMEMCVDTRENTLGNFGAYLPRLVQLKMNNSLIMSVRDLGTTLSHLQVLWMARCGLADLDGIPSFSSLKELYVAYNNISDLGPISMLDHLELLDLEGNSVDDITQVQYLGLCSQLSNLTLEGNPICTRPHPGTSQTEQYSYRVAVRELVPQLRYLDNILAGDTESHSGGTSVEDWDLLKECIKDSSPPGSQEETAEEKAASLCSYPQPNSVQHPATAISGPRPFSRASGCPASTRSVSSPLSRPGSADSDPPCLDQDASSLTHGVGRVICGNPVQALRARRQKIGLSALSSPSISPALPTSEHTFDLEEWDGQDRSDVFSELRVWRKEHSKRLQAIEKERQPQVMKISHKDEKEDEEEEGVGHSLSLTSDDEENGGKAGQLNTASPDSSINSPLPDVLFETEAVSPEISRLSLSPTPPLSPSPPPGLMVPPSGRSGASAVRVRRLRVKVSVVEPLRADEEVAVTESRAVGGMPTLEESRTRKPNLWPDLGAHSSPSPRPMSSPVVRGPPIPRTNADEGCRQPINGHQPVICSSAMTPERTGPPQLTHPLTAKAVLQRLPNRLALSPSKGPSH